MLKLSKTAIRELSKMYRAVLMGALIGGVFVATNVSAEIVDLTDITGTLNDGTTDYTITTGTATAEVDLSGYATAAQGAKADSAVQSVITGTANGTISVDGADVAVKGLGTAAYTDSTAYATAAQGAKADSAVQSIITGTANGTISVDGTDVAVSGLGTAAYTDSTAYATAAQGAKADSAVQSVITGTANGTISVDGTDVAVSGLGTAAYTDSTAYATAAQGALADSALQNGDNAQFNTLETTGNATINGDLNAGDTTVDSLTTTGAANLGTTTIVGKTTSAVISGNTTTTTREDLTVGSGLTVDTVTVTETDPASGSITIISDKTNISVNGDATVGGNLNVGTSIVMTENHPDYTDYSVLSVGSTMKDGMIEITGKDYSYISLNGEDGSILGSGQVGSSTALQVIVDEPATQNPYDYRTVFEADNSGNITNEGTITSGGLITAKGGITTASTVTGTTTYGGATLGDTTINGNITNTGTITSGGEIKANGGLTVKAGEDFTLGGTDVNDIDTTGVNRNNTGDEKTLTTTAAVVNTIKEQAQDATYINTVRNNSNVNSGTLNGAIADLDNAIGDRTLTSANGSINTGMATSLSAGLQAAGNAIGSLNYSSTNYVRAGSDLTTAVSALDNQLYQLNNNYNELNEEVRDMNKEMKAGFASVAALSGLQPNARAFNDTQISVGVGNYRGQTGFALGGFHYVNDNLMLNLGAAYAGEHSATFRGGLTFGW